MLINVTLSHGESVYSQYECLLFLKLHRHHHTQLDLRFPHKTMLGSSLPSVVCRSTYVLFTVISVCLYKVVCRSTYVLFTVISVCLYKVVSTHTVLCFCFSSSCVHYVAISLDCPFLIAPSVFSNVNLQHLR